MNAINKILIGLRHIAKYNQIHFEPFGCVGGNSYELIITGHHRLKQKHLQIDLNQEFERDFYPLAKCVLNFN